MPIKNNIIASYRLSVVAITLKLNSQKWPLTHSLMYNFLLSDPASTINMSMSRLFSHSQHTLPRRTQHKGCCSHETGELYVKDKGIGNIEVQASCLCLVPRLRIRGILLLRSLYAFPSWWLGPGTSHLCDERHYTYNRPVSRDIHDLCLLFTERVKENAELCCVNFAHVLQNKWDE